MDGLNHLSRSVFTEIDTGKRYIWGGSWPWIRLEQTMETILYELIDVNLDIRSQLAVLIAGQALFLQADGFELEEVSTF